MINQSTSDDHKTKIRQARQTDESREKTRQGSLGRKHSEESKEKMRKPKNKHSLNAE